MGNIRLLPPSLQNQIAAGEVVERPASIVKELLENSLDAAARHISIEINGGGIERIRITDDGVGMDKHDAEMAFERHATSKISTADDLFALHTFGFRGEALASIASVAEVELSTKRHQDTHGTKISFGKNGKIVLQGASVEGTDICVENLFYTVPARRKFLKTEGTEFRECMKVIESVAIANPSVSFVIKKDGKIISDFPAYDGEHAKKNRILEVLGKNAADALFPIHFLGAEMQISGFAGHPHWNRKDRSEQHIFVNHRPITRDANISTAVLESYRSLLPHGSHPIFVLFVEIDPSLVDVNVHPRKNEVKFLHPREVFASVKGAFETALRTANEPEKIPAFLPKTSEQKAIGEYPSAFSGKKFLSHSAPDTRPAFSRLSSEHFPLAPLPVSFREFSGSTRMEEKIHEAPKEAKSSPRRIIGQLKKSFILIEEEDGLVIVDQHAAHERVRYEALMKTVREKKPKSQQLLVPVVISVSSSDKALLEEFQDIFEDLGFQIEEFGKSEMAIYAVPEGNEKVNIEELFSALLKDLSGQTPEEAKATKTMAERIATYAACRGAIKFGDKLAFPEMEALIHSLDQCNAFYSCAHGRPIAMKISFEEMEKRCGR